MILILDSQAARQPHMCLQSFHAVHGQFIVSSQARRPVHIYVLWGLLGLFASHTWRFVQTAPLRAFLWGPSSAFMFWRNCSKTIYMRYIAGKASQCSKLYAPRPLFLPLPELLRLSSLLLRSELALRLDRLLWLGVRSRCRPIAINLASWPS